MAGKGRPSLYESLVKPELSRIPKLRRQGLTEEQVAKVLGVGITTFKEYKKLYPDLETALKKGKCQLIEDLEDTLYKKALGKCKVKTNKKFIEEVDGKKKVKIEETEQEIAPDTGALVFALKNLAPDRWKEVRDVNFSDLEEKLKSVKSFSERAAEIKQEELNNVTEESAI